MHVPGASVQPDSNVEAESPLTDDLSPGQIDQNIGDIVAFQAREHEKVGASQRRLEVVSTLIGRPLYLVSLLSMVKDRHDPEAVALQQRTDTSRVLSALESGGVGNDGRQTAKIQPRPLSGPNQGDET